VKRAPPWRSWGCDVIAAASNFNNACVALAGGYESRTILFNGDFVLFLSGMIIACMLVQRVNKTHRR